MKSFTVLLIFSFIASLSFKAWAFDVPALTGPVVDQVGILSTSTKNQLTQVLQQAHQNKGPQIQVLVISSLGELQIEEAAIKVFDQWKLGGEKEDNGVLFLIAPNEKKLRIEVGRGLEGDIPDVIAKRIVSDTVVPYFKRGEFAAGIVQGVQAILYYSKAQVSGADAAISQEPEQPPRGRSHAAGSNITFLILFILFIIFRFIFGGRGGGGGMFLGGGGGWSGGGGGGWSGGGGSSAGGGSSGSW